MKYVLVLVLAALLTPTAADSITRRSMAAKLAFARGTVCPSTSLHRISCPGYVIDHITPLCLGGPDKASNMQWQEYKESLIKDARERRMCAAAKNALKPKP